MFDSIRTYTVETHQYTTLAALSQKSLMIVTNKFDFLKHSLIKRSIDYQDEYKSFLMDALDKVDYLKNIPQ